MAAVFEDNLGRQREADCAGLAQIDFFFWVLEQISFPFGFVDATHLCERLLLHALGQRWRWKIQVVVVEFACVSARVGIFVVLWVVRHFADAHSIQIGLELSEATGRIR